MSDNRFGSIAQSVEQRTENPCVGSSILPRATIIHKPQIINLGFFYVPFYAFLCLTFLANAVKFSLLPNVWVQN